MHVTRYRLAKPKPARSTAIEPPYPLTIQIVLDTLSLVGRKVSPRTISRWTPEGRRKAYLWAMSEHLRQIRIARRGDE